MTEEGLAARRQDIYYRLNADFAKSLSQSGAMQCLDQDERDDLMAALLDDAMHQIELLLVETS